jgi:hypothetical protein
MFIDHVDMRFVIGFEDLTEQDPEGAQPYGLKSRTHAE